MKELLNALDEIIVPRFKQKTAILSSTTDLGNKRIVHGWLSVYSPNPLY